MKPSVNVRNFIAGEEHQWLQLLKEAYGNLESRSLEDIGQLVSSKTFSPDWLFLAEVGRKIVGSVRINPLPHKGYYELWDLAVSKKYLRSEISSLLVDKAVDYLKRKRAGLIRGYTLSIEPYVTVYINKGFKPVRRILRVDWNLEEDLPSLQVREDIPLREASVFSPEQLSEAFVKTLSPFWDWWVEDYGGPQKLAESSRPWFSESSDLRWLVAELDDKPVGLTGFTGKDGKGRLFGVLVLPEHRMERIGSTLMKAALDEAKRSGLKSLRVYTVAFLDRLAPGAILYLKSGGRMSAEYLQLE